MRHDTLVHKTPQLFEGKPGSRIKVLWIEDKPETVMANPQILFGSIYPYFDIYSATTPEDVAEAFDQARAEILGRLGDREYQLDTAPFDVYLGDWDLSRAGSGRSERSSRAKNAEAAGLGAAVLAASQFPQHPAAVLPYSAHWEKLEAYGELYRCMSPPTLYIAWQRGRELKSIQTSLFLSTISSLYREALIKASQLGSVSFSRSTVAEAQEALRGADNAREWIENGYLEMFTEWGKRTLRLRALWLDTFAGGGQPGDLRSQLLQLWLADGAGEIDDLNDISEDEIRLRLLHRWLAKSPALDEVSWLAYFRAVRYWSIARSPRSESRYRFQQQVAIDRSAGAEPLQSPLVIAHLQSLGISLEAAAKGGLDRLTVPSFISCPPILNSGLEDDRAKRLSVLTLVLIEEMVRLTIRDDPELRQLERDALEHLPRQIVRAAVEPDCDDIKQVLHRLFAAIETESLAEPTGLSRLVEDMRSTFRHLLPVGPEEIPQLIDPLPEKLYFQPSIAKGTRLGAALERLDPPLYLYEILSSGGPPTAITASHQNSLTALKRGHDRTKSTDKRDTYDTILGYNINRKHDELIITINQEEAAQVKFIFETFLAKLSLKKVGEELQRQGWLPKKSLKKTSWKPDLVQGILTNSIYLGQLEREGQHSAVFDRIITEDLFNKVRAQIGYPLREEIRVLRSLARELGLSREAWPWWLLPKHDIV